MDRYLVVSADGHAGPPAPHYREYLEPQYREPFDEHQASIRALSEAAKVASTNTEFVEKWERVTGGDGGLLAAYDSEYRSKVLDEEGVAAEVLFPDADVLGTGRVSGSPFGSGLAGGADSEPEFAFAGARAHNRWLADFVSEEPDRRIGIAIVPILFDLDGALAEIGWAREHGLRGVLIPTRWFEAPAYHDERYEPIWATCAELGMVVHTHSGSGPADYGLGPGMMAIYATEAYWWAARPLWVLIWSGVFERHPGLRYVVAENGAWWLPDIMRKMDEKYDGGHNTKKLGNVFREHLGMRPSEYFERNCFLAASTPGVEDIARRHDVGVARLLWGNDFPHPEGTFPYTRELVRRRFKDVPRDETARMLGGNAAALYGFDTAALTPLVERVGPRVDEIHGEEQLQEVPE